MKTQKNSQSFYLQKKNKRWKWMIGATAATTAGVAGSNASLVTVNLLDNYISSLGGNHLNADLTGDGQPDLSITHAANSYYRNIITTGSNSRLRLLATAGVNLNGVRASAYFNYGESNFLRLGSERRFNTYTLTGSIPILFKDLHINGGAPTSGSLEVTVSLLSPTSINPNVQLDSFTYNNRVVPDGGSSLALLAMGAGGILALRRWRTEQGRSENQSVPATTPT
jgi:hypothetical protein